MPARVPGRRVLVGVVLAFCATAGLPTISLSQQPLQGEGLALDLLEKLEFARAGADAITASMSLIVFKEQYCLRPDQPNKDPEEKFLKAREASLAEYRQRYNRLRAELLKLITRNGGARRVVDEKFEGNPMTDQDWDPWLQAFEKAKKAIGDKWKVLNPIPEVRCRALEPQQTAPDPTPSGPGIDLPEPRVRPVKYPEFKTPFCSQDEKQAVIQQFRAVAWDYYLNYQDARVYFDAITEALGQGRGNASALRSLLPGARTSLDVHTKALDDFNKELDRVRALPVIDCDPQQQQQTAPDPIPPLLFDPFVYPAVPSEFCTQDAKDETVRQLQTARNTARRNYDRAAARITELGDRIAKGDNSTTTSAAFREANERASEWLQQSRALDADMQRAAAMPVVECANKDQQSGLVRPGFGSEPGVTVGFIYNRATFTRMEGFARNVDGVATASSDRGINQFGGFVEVTYSNWYYGAGIRYGQHKVNQTFLSGGDWPLFGRARIGGYFGDMQVGYRVPMNGRITLGGYGGPVLTYNNGKFVWTYPDEEVEAQRTHWSIKTGVGAFAEYEVRPEWNVRFGLQHVSINSDADDHSGLYFSLNKQIRIGGYQFARPGTLPRATTPRSSTGRSQP